MTVHPRGIGPLTLVDEALVALTARPGRTVLTILGTVLGVGALIVTVGLARTAGDQILRHLDEASVTEVRVQPADGPDASSAGTAALPFDAARRIDALPGVRAAVTLAPVADGQPVTTFPVAGEPRRAAVSVSAASPGLLAAVDGRMATGRMFDAGHDRRHDAVGVVGPGAAALLGIHRVDQRPVVFLHGRAVTIIGILATVGRLPDLTDAVVVPFGLARRHLGVTAVARLVARTELGAGPVVGSQAALALDPNEPERLEVLAPPDLRSLQERVRTDADGLFVALGAVSTLVGAVGIANVTLVGVLERTGEIGLRQALGATRSAIAGQFLLESTLLGLLGGLVGMAAGLLVLVATCAARHWAPVLDPRIPLATPLLGALVGLLAGAWPAARAANVPPVHAMKG